jgi:hypothetical protein
LATIFFLTIQNPASLDRFIHKKNLFKIFNVQLSDHLKTVQIVWFWNGLAAILFSIILKLALVLFSR